MHYNSNHRYVCIECKKSLPNPRLLDIHIQEIHDSFFQVLSMKKPMVIINYYIYYILFLLKYLKIFAFFQYQCYVSECDLKFNNSLERKDHCINVHKFPKNFRFDNTSHCIKNKSKDKMDIDESEYEKKEQKSKKIQLNKNQKTKMFAAAAKNIPSTNSNISSLNSSNIITGANSLHFIPRQVQKSYTKALTKNQTNEKNVLETASMLDLADSLPAS